MRGSIFRYALGALRYADFYLEIYLKLHKVKVGERAEFAFEFHLAGRISGGTVTKIYAGS
jgi:hypothetical protein